MTGDTEMIADLDLTPMLNCLDQVTRHFEALPGAAFGVQLDTGMNRLGMEKAEWDAVAPIVLDAGPRLVSPSGLRRRPDHQMNARQLAAFPDDRWDGRAEVAAGDRWHPPGRGITLT